MGNIREAAPTPSMIPEGIVSTRLVSNMPEAVLPRPPLDLPPPHKRGIINGELKHTAEHELNHAIPALEHNVNVKYISVIAQGNSLGRTVFDGFISQSVFNIVAAGGAVETAQSGPAKGFSHDAFQIWANNGGSLSGFDSYKNKARTSINKFPKEIRGRAAEIIAFLGVVSGSMIPLIIEQAKYEIDMEKRGFSTHIDGLSLNNDLPKDLKTASPHTEISIGTDGRVTVTYVDESVDTQAIRCPICGSFVKGSHSHQFDKERNTNGLLPQSAAIYIRNPRSGLKAKNPISESFFEENEKKASRFQHLQ